MKNDGTLIRVDLDFKNAFNSAGHSCLWTIREGFGVPDVWLLKNIYENSSMRVQVGGEDTAAIQLDTGTVQGSVLSPLLFDLIINALLRLLDSTGIPHKVRNAPDWNHQAFADDLSLCTENTSDAHTLLRLVQQFQEWSGLKISTKKSLATGALYGREAWRGRTIANAKARRAKTRTAKSRELTVACEEDEAFDPGEQDLQVEGAVHTIQRNTTKIMCKTCGVVQESHHFYVTDPKRCCRQCATSWSPRDIEYEGVRLKTTPGRSTTRLLGIHQSMWLDSSAQWRKVINGAIEVSSYLRNNEDLRIDQALKVVSMCLPPLFSFSAPLIRWPEAEKILTAIWLRAYNSAWNIGRSTAACLLIFPRENGGLQVKLPLVTLFDSMWGNLERCHQFDDGTRQMMRLAYQEALTDNACSNVFELQKEAGLETSCRTKLRVVR